MDPLTRLALAAKDGDRRALDQLVEGSYEQVWRLCARFVDDQCADDLAQDTFIQPLVPFQLPWPGLARTWLLAIARNTCIDELRTRSRRRRRDASLGARLLVGGQVVDDIGQEIGVSDALARLAPERREAFVLTQLLGLSYQEAAEACACPPGTVGSRVARARADLPEDLEHARQDRDPSENGYTNVTSMYPIARPMTTDTVRPSGAETPGRCVGRLSIERDVARLIFAWPSEAPRTPPGSPPWAMAGSPSRYAAFGARRRRLRAASIATSPKTRTSTTKANSCHYD